MRGLPILVVLAVAGCPSPSGPDAHFVCDAVSPDSCADPLARFADIKPILDAHCASCHTNERGAPWPFDTYADVADWSDLLRADLVTCSMPPTDAGTVLSREERAQILDWIRCGLPE